MKKYLIFVLFFALSISLKASQSSAGTFPAGSLLVQANLESATVYYIGDDGKKYIFPDAKTYFTWFNDFDDVKKVSVTELDQYPDGGIVPYRAGTKLITHQNTAKVYAVEPGGIIRWIKDEEIAKNLYGDNWSSMVQDVLPGFFSASYELGEDMADILPTGTIVQESGSSEYYYIENNLKRKIASLEVMNINNLNISQAIIVGSLDSYKNGPEVAYKESELTECHYKYKYKQPSNNNSSSTEDVIDNSKNNKSADIDLSLSKSTAYIYPYFEDSVLIDVVLYDETGECIPYTEIYAYATQQEQIDDKAKTAGGAYCGRALFVYRPTTAGEHSISFSAVGIEKEIKINVVEHESGFVEIKKLSEEKENLVAETNDIKLGDLVFSNIIPFDNDVTLNSVILSASSTGFTEDFLIHANTYYGTLDSKICSVGFCELEFDLNNYKLSQDEIYNVFFTVDTPVLEEGGASICIDYVGGAFRTEAGVVSETVLDSQFDCASSTISG